MAINNLNPRRTVWFSPYEPSNKYDIWLSKNAHYDENGEPTTDSNSQRDCDYIFKIYDCGKWQPIVGFNSTAANKINTVSGVTYTYNNVDYPSKTVCHPALFTAETPNELFDYGSMGKVLKELVTATEWGEIYNTYFKTIIEQYPFDLWPAESNTLGGIMMNMFPSVDLQHFSEIKYYNNSNKHPFADVSDIVSIINSGNAGTINGTIIGNENWTIDSNVLYRSFYNSPSIRKGWDETQGSTQAIKPRFELNGSTTPDNRGKFLKLKDANDSWWSGIEHDYGETDNCFDWVELNLDYLSDVEISNPTQGQSLVYDGDKWVNGDTSSTDTWRPIQVNDNPIASDYTFDIHSGIGITFSTTQSNREAVCKIEQNVQYSNENDAPILTGDLLVHTIPINTSYPHGGCQIQGTYQSATGNHYLTGPYICRTVLYNVTSASTINFNVIQTPSLFDGNPVYYKLKITGDSSNVSITFVEGSEYIICDEAVVSDHLNPKYNNYFITIQFGMVKIEPIMTQSSTV